MLCFSILYLKSHSVSILLGNTMFHKISPFWAIEPKMLQMFLFLQNKVINPVRILAGPM